MEVATTKLKRAVESQHLCWASLVTVVDVKEVVDGKSIWEGIVHIFDLQGHPKATRAYAWSSPVENGGKRRFHAVLHLCEIRTQLDAVRATIAAEQRAEA